MEKHASNMITKTISILFKRFHLMLFFIFIVGCLAGAVIMVNKILIDSSDTTGYTSAISAGSIDETTLQRIQSLHTSNQDIALPPLPEGRVNAFSE